MITMNLMMFKILLIIKKYFFQFTVEWILFLKLQWLPTNDVTLCWSSFDRMTGFCSTKLSHEKNHEWRHKWATLYLIWSCFSRYIFDVHFALASLVRGWRVGSINDYLIDSKAALLRHETRNFREDQFTGKPRIGPEGWGH